MKKKTKIVLGLTGSLIVLLPLAGLIVTGSLICWGPFRFLGDIRLSNLPGNRSEYHLENVKELENSPLKGKKIAYLGSSVTYGAYAQGTSFVEYISKMNGCTHVKEAVSGTTLTKSDSSYVSRIEKFDKKTDFDLFVCQLSTNDASKNKPLGEIHSEDTSTVCGAINYIYKYATETWHCPFVVYTNSYYENWNYKKMVNKLGEMSAMDHGIQVIDLFGDERFNNITDEERKLYMVDKIHPSKAGYLKWWTPEIEKAMYSILAEPDL